MDVTEYIESLIEMPSSFATASWQEAYAALLLDYYEQYDGEYSLYFLLYDIDMDGIPELFISERGDWIDHIDVVYTFRGGETIFLEFGEGVSFMPHLFSGSGPVLSPAPDGVPGIIASAKGVGSIFGGNNWANLIAIDGYRLIVESRGEWIVDVAALHNLDANDINEDTVMEHTTITINGNIVSKQEYMRIFGLVYPDLRPHSITEGNIRDIIFSH